MPRIYTAGLAERDGVLRIRGDRQRERAFAERRWTFRDPPDEEMAVE